MIISEASKACGISTKTIRFYEEQQLIALHKKIKRI